MPQLYASLEALRDRWHHLEYLGSDPLALVLDQAHHEDREVVGLLVSCLALGRVSLIVPAARRVLALLGESPARALRESSPQQWEHLLEGFRYRFFSGAQVAALLGGIGRVLREHHSLEEAWRSTGKSGWEALGAFSSLIVPRGTDAGILLPVADSGGASKRLNLYLRWMVRRDVIDPGGWSVLSPRDLLMPVDTHVLQWAQREGLTTRKTADRRSCEDVTAALRLLCPEDPLRWDFAITRQGMEDKNTLGNF